MLKKQKKPGTPGPPPAGNIIYPSKKKVVGALLALMLGIAMFPASVLTYNAVGDEIDKGIAEQITVPDPEDDDYDEWKSNDYSGAVPIYTKFYMWNLTNPAETLQGSKPIFSELGPYTFREYSYKYNVKFDDDNDEVSFNSYTRYSFRPDASKGLSLRDKITNFNPAYLGVLEETGSEAGLIRVMFPVVLQEVRTLFGEELNATMEELLTEEGIRTMLIGEITNMLDPLIPILGVEAVEVISTGLVDFLKAILNLTEFMIDAMPTAEQIFFEEWANDYFPEVHADLAILFDKILQFLSDLIDAIIDLIFFWDVLHLFDAIKDALFEELNATMYDVILNSPFSQSVKIFLEELIQDLGAQLVDEEGSATGEGVDIDGGDPYNYPGPYADLNISTHSKGGSGINQTQCQALWDDNNPISLTGFDGLENPIWFDALEGDVGSKDILMDEFSLNETQLNYILDWIEVSVNGWLKNLCEWQILDWNSGLLTTRTVEEWLFYANDTLVYNQDPARARVGVFSNCHNSTEADEAGVNRYTIKTGKGDINEVCQTVKFNGNDEIEIWAEDIKVGGTDGSQFAPGVTRDDKLKVWVSDFVRPVELEFDKITNLYDIDLYRFRMEDDTFEINPDYYMDIDGCINVLPDLGTPGYLSKPHFLDGDDSLLNSIGGMSEPEKADHDTYIEVEPITGITMNARQRMQVNLKVRQTDWWYPNVTEAIMPVLWLDSKGEITEEKAEEFKDLVYGALDMQRDLRLIVLGVGATLLYPGAKATNTQVVKHQVIKTQRKKFASKKLASKKKSKFLNLKLSKETIQQSPKHRPTKKTILKPKKQVKKS